MLTGHPYQLCPAWLWRASPFLRELSLPWVLFFRLGGIEMCYCDTNRTESPVLLLSCIALRARAEFRCSPPPLPHPRWSGSRCSVAWSCGHWAGVTTPALQRVHATAGFQSFTSVVGTDQQYSKYLVFRQAAPFNFSLVSRSVFYCERVCLR